MISGDLEEYCNSGESNYYEGWKNGIKECLKLAESIDDTYIVDTLKKWLGYE